MFFPIFIYVREKSDKELREEMERDAKWARLMEEEKRLRLEQERKRKEKKKAEKEEKLKKLNEEYEKSRSENPWDYQFMPEGWSIFGQTYITVIDE